MRVSQMIESFKRTGPTQAHASHIVIVHIQIQELWRHGEEKRQPLVRRHSYRGKGAANPGAENPRATRGHLVPGVALTTLAEPQLPHLGGSFVGIKLTLSLRNLHECLTLSGPPSSFGHVTISYGNRLCF